MGAKSRITTTITKSKDMKWIVIIVFFVGINLNGKTLTVCSSCEIKTIRQAIDLASEGDEIRIKKGVYREYDLNITKKLKIIGESGVVIDGEKKGQIFWVNKVDGVELRDMKIINVGVSYTTDFSAVRMNKCKNFVIDNLHLEKLFFGLYIAKSSHGLIQNNTISGDAKDEYNSGNGIHLWYSKNITIKNNQIEGARDGIYFEFADNCSIIDNLSQHNLRYGLHFMFSNHDDYIGNTFIDNGAGVAVMFSKYINMKNNTFLENWGASSYGLLLKEIYDAEIEKNTFRENTVGIQIEGSTRINYLQNNFENNGWAVKVSGAAYANNFKYNNFLNNSFDLSYNSNLNDNLFSENYWSEYTGYDLNRDGYGDVAHRPVKLFAYIANKTPEAIVLLRSLFVDIINFSEKVSPVFTPDNLVDAQPKITPYTQ